MFLRYLTFASLGILILFSPANAADTPKVPDPPKAAADPVAPKSIDDLKAIQEQTKAVLKKVIPCTVGILINTPDGKGKAAGSGVIVSKDGYILTAGHVSGPPGKTCELILSDGTTLQGKTLGNNPGIDSGMMKIVPSEKDKDKEWPFVEMGKASSIKLGQWVIAVGHPNGYQKGRSPVVRLGRVLTNSKSSMMTDCTLVGGDSGGPLFNMRGELIGIHSRIGPLIAFNIHVPIDTYRETWDKLAQGEVIGTGAERAFLGLIRDESSKPYKVDEVVDGSPADKAGLKAGDVIVKFDGKECKAYGDVLLILNGKKPDDTVAIEVKRDGETVALKVKLKRRGLQKGSVN